MKLVSKRSLIAVCLCSLLTGFAGCSKSDDTATDTTTSKTDAKTNPNANVKSGGASNVTPQAPGTDTSK